jgi:hypothetical protein
LESALITAVAYGPFGLVPKLWLVLAGSLLLAFFILQQGPGDPSSLQKEWLPAVPGKVWVATGALLILGRSIALTTFWGYPLYDEVFNAYYALHLLGHWTWHPFFFFSQLPPLYIWLLAGLFKLFGFSTSLLWGLPAFLSILCPFTFYAAARQFFSRSISFMIFLVTAFGFWPLYLGRFSHQAGLMLWIEGLAFWALGHYVNAPSDRKRVPALLLGASLGAGFYTYFAWPVVALGVILIVAWRAGRGDRRERAAFGLFAATTALIVSPLVFAALHHGYGSYIARVYHAPVDSALYNEAGGIRQVFSYFSVFLWTSLKGYFTYGPFWGGLFDPLLGAAGLLGLTLLYRYRRHPEVLGTAFCALLFFAPVPFTNIFNVLRLTPLIPIAGAIVGLGIYSLFGGTRTAVPRSGWLLAVFFLISSALTLTNLVCTRWAGNNLYRGQRDPSYVRFFQWTREKQKVNGPGELFLQFQPDPWDPSLWVMTHPFNTLEKAEKEPASPAWGAILVEDIYKPYLEKRFPGIQWQVVSTERRRVVSNVYFRYQVLGGLFPIRRDQEGTLEKWVQANAILQDLVYQDHEQQKGTLSIQRVQRWLQEAPHFQDDPFLRTWFWERISDEFLELDLDSEALSATQKSLQAGLPLGSLYQQYGLLLLNAGHTVEGKAALAQAARLDPRLKVGFRVEGR